MLTPFQFAILTVEDARLLADYIRQSTSTKTCNVNYGAMQKAGVCPPKLSFIVGGSR